MKRLFQLLLFAAIAVTALPAVAEPIECDQSAVIDVAAAATDELVAAPVGGTVHVCGFALSGDTAATIGVFQTGTGTACATGTVAKTGNLRFLANTSLAHGGGVGLLFSGAYNSAVCLQATTGAVTGILQYKIQ